MVVDTSSGAASRPEPDCEEATSTEPRIRHTITSDSSSGVPSRPETDRGEAIKGSPEYDVPWLQIPPLAQLIARKQIVGRPRKWSPEYTHASENTVFSTVCFLFLFTSRFRTCDRRLKESSRQAILSAAHLLCLLAFACLLALLACFAPPPWVP